MFCGPIVFEAPPNLQGIPLDFWQRPMPVDGGKFAGDVGLPGPDGGKGEPGRLLCLPLRQMTCCVLILARVPHRWLNFAARALRPIRVLAENGIFQQEIHGQQN